MHCRSTTVTQRHRRRLHGFTYIGVLVVVVLMGLTFAGVGVIWRTQKQRENEKELLFNGDQYRRAIGMYYERSPGTKQFPPSIDDLLVDRRYPNVQRYLRRPYSDPMTGKQEWGLVLGPGGGIVGVYSRSDKTPFRTAHFKVRDASFQNAKRYSDWQFIYVPAMAIPSK